MRAFFVAGVDELEEQVAAAGRDRQVADLVDDEQRAARHRKRMRSRKLPSRSALASEAMMSASVEK